MADYGSTTVLVRFGEQSDFSDKVLNRAAEYDSTTATASFGPVLVTANSTGVTFRTDLFGSVQTLVIRNKSSTVAVEARWTSLAPVTGATANKQLVAASGAPLVLPSCTVASNLVLITSSSTAECEIFGFGTLGS